MKFDDLDISLRIRGGSFSSRKISKALGLRPRVVRAADRSRIVDLESDEPAAYWSHKFKLSSKETLQEAIAVLAHEMVKHRIIFQELRSNGSEVELFVGLTFERSSGHELTWKVFAELAKAKVNLSLDLYSRLGQVNSTSQP